VPAKIRPGDWDRLFAPNAPRRGGPLRTLLNLALVFIVITLIGVGSVFAVNYRNERIASQQATLDVVAPTLIARATQTVAAATAAADARTAARTATALASQPTAEPTLGSGLVTSGGNLRKEPRVAPDTVIGLLWTGDQVTFLEEQLVGGQSWFRIRVITPATNRGGDGVGPGTVGWVSGTLLSQPTPVVRP
jgi:hypothetical protein